MNIIIFGGSGFIGQAFIKENISRYKILNYSRSKIKIKNNNLIQINDDVLNIDKHLTKIKKFEPEVCLNFFWEGIPNFSNKMCNLNLKKNKIILDSISNINCKKIISTGTCMEYNGLQNQVFENDIGNKLDIFGKTKIKIKDYQEKKCKSNKINSVWLRLFYVYGINQRKESLIPFVINKIKNDEKIELKNPSMSNDYIFLDDVIKIIENSIYLNDQILTLNVGSGKLVKNQKIARTIAKIYKKEYLIVNNFEKEKKKIYFYASTKLMKKKLFFKKFISLKNGLKKLIKI